MFHVFAISRKLDNHFQVFQDASEPFKDTKSSCAERCFEAFFFFFNQRILLTFHLDIKKQY